MTVKLCKFRRRLRGFLSDSSDEGINTPSSSSSSCVAAEDGQSDSGASSQQDCKSPTQIGGESSPQGCREEPSQTKSPSFIKTAEEQQEEGSEEQPPQRPPSYYAIFPPGSYPESPPRTPAPAPTPPSGEREETEPLAEAVWHNIARSPLCRLPDRLLTRIIDMLDNSGVECMRRVARRFPPLCVGIIHDRPRALLSSEVPYAGGWPYKWPRLRSMSSTGQAQELLRWAEGRGDALPADRAQFLSLLHRDQYCDGCRAAREAPDWEKRTAQLRRFLHCSVCRLDHPACLFSHTQRIQGPHRRRCIAHEGYIRICGHEKGIIRWSDVLDYKRKMEPPTEDPGLRPVQCRDDSHIVVCKDTAIGDVVKRRNLYPGCRINKCQEYIFPSFQVWKKTIFLHWTAHLPLGQTEWPITAAGLRPRLAELRDNAGRFICPALAPGVGMDFPELRCFDPNCCDCVSFEDSQRVLDFEGDYTAHHAKCLFPLIGLARPCLDAKEEKPKECDEPELLPDAIVAEMEGTGVGVGVGVGAMGEGADEAGVRRSASAAGADAGADEAGVRRGAGASEAGADAGAGAGAGAGADEAGTGVDGGAGGRAGEGATAG
ncbi:hypothetical protein VPNG_09915, partial [Cytospora leucostoma]